MSERWMDPYRAGFLLGLVLLAALFVSGRGLGASGAYRSVVVAAVSTAAPEHARTAPFYARALAAEPRPLGSWLVLEVLGVLAGAFLSGVAARRTALAIERPAHVSAARRLAFAGLGGALFGVGAMFARGCTSGAALTGMATFSTGGFVTTGAIFGSAYGLAWFVRRLWIPATA